ncbi:MAG: OmpA family protein [Bauldia sp.]|nr:OmpA family protein [Bauldia sp.]MCW5716884.1 OmpA family protein [Bauldia sp.]
MRNVARRRSHEEEEESVFVSMTDVTVSFLFIVILLLAFFASQYREEQDDETVLKTTYDEVVQQRDDLQAERSILVAELTETTAELATVRTRLEATEADLSARTIELNELRLRLAELEAVVAALRLQLSARVVEIATLRNQLSERDAEIVRLQALIAELETLVQTLQGEVGTLREEIVTLSARVAELEAALAAAVVDPLERYLQQAAQRRELILREVGARLIDLQILGIQITVSSDALSISGERGLFDSGVWSIRPDGQAIVDTIARALDELLPCFSIGEVAAWNQQCNPSAAVVDAVQIEGHTDADADAVYNLDLSTDRANETFKRMIGQVPGLLGHLNLNNRPVLSVAGYGEWRPIATNETLEGKARNRRIDLRIIMYTPNGIEDVERVGEQLRNAGG